MEYSGFLFDTFRGLMQCTEVKLAFLRKHTAAFGSLDLAYSMRDLDCVKGRLLHYSAVIRHLRIRVMEMQHLVGPLSAADSGDSARVSPYATTVNKQYNLAGPLLAGLAELAT